MPNCRIVVRGGIASESDPQLCHDVPDGVEQLANIVRKDVTNRADTKRVCLANFPEDIRELLGAVGHVVAELGVTL